MLLAMLGIAGTAPLWFGAWCLTIEARRCPSVESRVLARQRFSHLFEVGHILTKELYGVRRVVSENMVWSPEEASRVASATPDDELFAVRFPISVLVERLSRLALSVDMKVLTADELVAIHGPEIFVLFDETNGFVLGLREKVPTAYIDYCRLLDELDLIRKERLGAVSGE